jgi:hypothetical protein
VEAFPSSTGQGLGCSSEGSAAEREKVSSGTARSYGSGVIYSEFGFFRISAQNVFDTMPA